MCSYIVFSFQNQVKIKYEPVNHCKCNVSIYLTGSGSTTGDPVESVSVSVQFFRYAHSMKSKLLI